MEAGSEIAGVAGAAPRMVKVWDPFVRIAHWTIVAGFFIAYLTEDDPLWLHVWAGYVVGVVAVLRIAWGLVGPRHARFTDFVFGPGKVLGYLGDLALFRGRRYLGHSPAGGAMVLALLAGLLAVVYSGLELYAIEEGAGPLAMSSAVEVAQASDPQQGGEENKDSEAKPAGEELWETLHEGLANFVLFLVVLHVVGVVLASIVHRENLVRSMVTGLKRADGGRDPDA